MNSEKFQVNEFVDLHANRKNQMPISCFFILSHLDMEHVMADIVKTRIFVCCSEDNGYKLWAIACRLRKIAIDFRIFSCSQQDLK